MTAESTGGGQLGELLASRIRDVPDYPKAGVLFKDIAPLLGDAKAFSAAVDWFAAQAGDASRIVGLEARGFVLAAPAAYRAGLGFVPVRKAGKLPGPVYSVSYELEYGSATLEVQRDAFEPGERVLIVDDVLATGGTVLATIDLIRQCGAEPVGVAVLMELEFLGGRSRLPRDLTLSTILTA